MARATSGIPGPSSRATTTMPELAPLRTTVKTISPCLAYWTMFRAISEIAVATRVRSLPEKPTSAASSRTRCRAIRMSCSERIGSRVSCSIGHAPGALVQVGQPLFQVEARGHPIEAKAELDHREGDL